MRTPFLTALGIICVSSLLLGQKARVYGTITDAHTHDPLVAATVLVDGSGTVSDLEGRYELFLEPGDYALTFSYVGYHSEVRRVSLAPGQALQLDVSLREEANLLATATVTAGKYEKPLGEVTVSLEVIKPGLIERTNSASIDQALVKVPGVHIIGGQANIRGGSGFSYGAGSRVLLLINDVPALQADAGFTNWNDVPVENISQVEVVKGAASALYGSSAMNGIVNIRTAYAKSGSETKAFTFASLYDAPRDPAKKWWHNDTIPYKAGLGFAHRQRFDRLDLVLGGYLFDERSYNEATYNRYGRINISAQYHFTDRLTAGVYANFNRGRSGSFFFWRDGEAGTYRAHPNTLTETPRKWRYMIDPYLTYFDAKGNKYRYIGRWFHSENEVINEQSNSSDFLYNEFQYQHRRDAHAAVLTMGLVHSATFVSAQLYGDTTFAGTNLAAYLQYDRKFFDRLNLSAGLRYERYTLENPPFEYLGQTLAAAKAVEAKPVFRFGANYQLAPYTYVRASWGQGYRFPTVAEKFITTTFGGIPIIPNLQLTSETGWSAELALKQGLTLAEWRGFVDVAGFWTEYYDMIEFGFAPNFLAFQAQNIGDTRIRGIDINIAGSGAIGGLEAALLAGYTWIDPRFLNWSPQIDQGSSADYNVLKYRFRHSAKVDLEVRKRPFALGAYAFYNSFMEAIDALFESDLVVKGLKNWRAQHQQGHLVLGVRAAWAVHPSFKLSFLVDNLLNAEYMLRPALLEPTRTFTLRLDYAMRKEE